MEDVQLPYRTSNEGLRERLGIPLENLDYQHIEKCTNVKEVEKILKILRSGEEGIFPDLIKFCETKLHALDPENRHLRISHPVDVPHRLPPDEWKDIENDLLNWSDNIKNKEELLDTFTSDDLSNLPPVRNIGEPSSQIVNAVTSEQTAKIGDKKDKPSRALPRSYQEWDNVTKDVDKILDTQEKVEISQKQQLQAEQKKTPVIESEDFLNDTKDLTSEEKLVRAAREKDKGNESFNAGDYDEALHYYTRSISLSPLVASFNNRALVEIKLNKYEKAIADCDTVLSMEPNNIKALLRRGLAYNAVKMYSKAKSDLEMVINIEPQNKRAQQLLTEVHGSLGKNTENDENSERVKTNSSTSPVRDDSVDQQHKIHEMGPTLLKDEQKICDDESASSIPVSLEDKSNSEMIESVAPTASSVSDIQHSDLPSTPSSRVNLEEMTSSPAHNPRIVESSDEHLKETIEKNQDMPAAVSEPATVNDVLTSDHVVTKDGICSAENRFDVDAESKKEVIETEDKTVESLVTSLKEKSETLEKTMEDLQKIRKQLANDYTLTNDEDNETVTHVGFDSTVINKSITGDSQQDFAGSTQSKENVVDYSISSSAETVTTSGTEAKTISTTLPTEMKSVMTTLPAEKKSVVSAAVHAELPTKILHLKNKGAEYFKSGQYEAATDVYGKAINLLDKESGNHNANKSVLYSNRAACRLKTGDCKGCIDDCNLALDLAPHSFKPILRKASAYETLEKFKDAYVNYRHALSIDNTSATALEGSNRCTKLLMEQEGPRWREALPRIPSVPVNLSTWDTPPKQHVVTLQSGQPTDYPDMPKLEDENSDDEKENQTPEERFEEIKSQGNQFVQKGSFTDAINCYTECISLFPDQPVSYANRALCYLKLNQGEKAVQDCSKTLELQQDNVKALFRRAQAQRMLSQYKLAMQDLITLLKIEPNNKAAKKEIDAVKDLYKMELEKQKESLPAEKRRVRIQQVNRDENNSDKENIKLKKDDNKVSIENRKAKESEKSNWKKDESKMAKERKFFSKEKENKNKLHASKTSAYEFLLSWNSLRRAEGLEPYANLLSQVNPCDLPKVISNKLDGDMLNTMVACIDEYFIENNKLDLAYQYLSYLCQVQRFGMVSMFFSDEQRSQLQGIFTKLKHRSKGSFSTKDIDILSKKFAV